MSDYSYMHVAQLSAKYPKPLVLVTGCFDVLHLGHASLLEFADTLGRVYVGVNSDDSVKKLKGEGRPINNQDDRMALLDHFPYVFFTFIIHETTVTKALREIKPTYWVKGSDYTLDTLNQDERRAADSVGVKIVFAPKLEGHSSTNIIERMKR